MKKLTLSNLAKFDLINSDLDGTLVKQSKTSNGVMAKLKNFANTPNQPKAVQIIQCGLASSLKKREYINGAGLVLPEIKKLGKSMHLVTKTSGHLMPLYGQNKLMNATAPIYYIFDKLVTGDLVATDSYKDNLEHKEQLYRFSCYLAGAKRENSITFEDDINEAAVAAKLGMNVCYVGSKYEGMEILDNNGIEFQINTFEDLLRN